MEEHNEEVKNGGWS